MLNTLTHETLATALRRCGRELKDMGAPHTGLVVLPGSKLQVMGYFTGDPAKAAYVNLHDGVTPVTKPLPLPYQVMIAAQKVAGTLLLPHDWLTHETHGPFGRYQISLPKGYLQRIELHTAGENLSLYTLSRTDQIAVRLFTAVDTFDSEQAEELSALNPSEMELMEAARWAIAQDSSVAFERMLDHFLGKPAALSLKFFDKFPRGRLEHKKPHTTGVEQLSFTIS